MIMRLAMLGFILLMTIGVQAQDKIYQAGGKIILAKIQEIGVDEVKYKLFEDLEGPTYGIEKDRVVKIIFQNGRTETYRSGLRDPELYAGQQKDALKLNFMSPLFGHTQLFYERSLKPGRSIEFSLDLVGAGKNYTIDYVYYDPNNPNPQEVKRGAAGAGIGVGYKFIRTPDFINRNIRYAHLLQGTYIKPNLLMGLYGENILDAKTGTPIEERRTVFYSALMVELGKQWIFGDSFVFDIFFGIGYSVDNINDDDYIYSASSNEGAAMHFTHTRFGSSPGFALNGGLKIGMLLGK
jgi:hypothetical protein